VSVAETAFFAAMIARAGSLEAYQKALEAARARASKAGFPAGLPLSRKQIEEAIDRLAEPQQAA
jgi:hypothetical protein